MPSHSLNAKRFLLNTCLLLTFCLGLSATQAVFAQPADYAAERRRAIDLYDQNKFADAIPILEKLVTIKNDDVDVWERLGWATLVVAGTMQDPAQRKQARERARRALLRAQQLGDDSNLLHQGLEILAAPDQADLSFSVNKEADAAMREGEAAHARGDLDQALAKYRRALEFDPKLYEAALFAGDMEFKKGYNSTDPQYRNAAFDRSGVWFAKAIAIDPNRETAYRYWGDALDAQGKTNDALDRFVEAIIADPYNRSPYVGLTQWAQRHKVQLGHPKIEPPNAPTTQGDKTTVNIDPRALNSTDGSNNWLMYSLTRVAWSKSDFFRNYPAEKTYRHSLKEEAAALRMVADACAKDLQSGKVKALEPSLAMLVKLNEDGFIEPYVLFARPNQGIARDYPAYRATNRDQLKRYWISVVIIASRPA
jgi:tetratricopeptide (TPR) repeat protein